MQKITTALVALTLSLFALNGSAQNVVEQGTSIGSVGVGMDYRTYDGHSSGVFTLSGAYDYGLAGYLWDDNSALTLGGYLSASSWKYSNSVTFGPRLGLHYHFIPQLDTYVSLILAYSHMTWRDEYKTQKHSSAGGFDWGGHLGVRYMFQPTIGMFAEVGYGISLLNIGVSFKF